MLISGSCRPAKICVIVGEFKLSGYVEPAGGLNFSSDPAAFLEEIL